MNKKQSSSTSFWSGSIITFKLIALVILTLVLLIPKFMLTELVKERETLNNAVSDEVSNSWAKDQLITGPYLVLNYWEEHQDSNKKQVRTSHKLTIMPEDLNIHGDITTEDKNRGLYKVLLYKSQIKLTGNFQIPNLKELNIANHQVNWKESFICCSISDPKGIINESFIQIDSTKLRMNPGMLNIYVYSKRDNDQSPLNKSKNRIFDPEGFSKNGLSVNYPIFDPKKTIAFDFSFQINGSRSLVFSPVGKNTKTSLQSSFADPSFIGEFLPSHDLSKNGFTAKWNIVDYNKSIPFFINKSTTIDLGNNFFGVSIQNSVNHYSKTDRACKYLLLFILVTFLSVFLTEIVYKIKIHIFQYTLFGLALTIFFALLLSISEFINFNISYAISSFAVTIMIYIYSLSVFSTRSSSHLLSLLIISLFSFIFIIIQLEKTALLFGTIMLFAILGLTMYITRKINWYEKPVEINENIIY